MDRREAIRQNGDALTRMSEIQKHLRRYYQKLFSNKPIPDNVSGLQTQNAPLPSEFVARVRDTRYSSHIEPKYTPVNVSTLREVLTREFVRNVCDELDVYSPMMLKLIVMSGCTGSGKTSHIGQIVLDWSDNLPGLRHFDLVFYVNVSSIRLDNSGLCEFLVDSGMLPRNLSQDLGMLLDKPELHQDMLFIFDDFCDGPNQFVTDVVNGDTLPRATVIVSGRPAILKGHKLLVRPADITLELLGIGDNGVEQLLLQLLDHNREMIKSVLKFCRSQLLDMTMLRNPLITVLVCYTHYISASMRIDVKPQPDRHITMTELLHTIFKACVKVMMVKRHPPVQCNTAFNGSPLLDENCSIPANVKRLVYQLGKVSFEALKVFKYQFAAVDLQQAFIDTDELNELGLMRSVITTDHSLRDDKYEFCHKIFQDYFAGLYIASKPQVLLMHIQKVIEKLDRASANILREKTSGKNEQRRKSVSTVKRLGQMDSDGSGHDLEAWKVFLKSASTDDEKNTANEDQKENDPSDILQKTKKDQKKTQRGKKNVEHTLEDCVTTICNIPYVHYKDETVEYAREQLEDLKLYGDDNYDNIDQSTGGVPQSPVTTGNPTTRQSQETPDTTVNDDSEGSQTNLTLTEILHPFETAVLLACGAKPELLEQILTLCQKKTSLKVCQGNPNKCDIGYEALLYSESYHDGSPKLFFEYFMSLSTKRPSALQTPTSFEEIATTRLVASFNSLQARCLLKRWYSVSILSDVIVGANIAEASTTQMDFYNPCLVEGLLLQKFQHTNIEVLGVDGNYFPDFEHLFASFPILKSLTIKDTSIAEMTSTGCLQFGLDIANGFTKTVPNSLLSSGLEVVDIADVHFSEHAWQQLKRALSVNQATLKHMSFRNVVITNAAGQLLSLVEQCLNLETLRLVNMGFHFSNVVLSGGTNPGTISTLSSTLRNLNKIKTLDFSHNSMVMAIPAVIRSLEIQAQHLETMNLERCSISSDAFRRLVAHLQSFTGLQTLNISQNMLSESAEEFFRALTKACGTTLRCLLMRKCGLTENHVKSLTALFSEFYVLETLDISDNQLQTIGPEFVSKVAVGVSELVLSNCGLNIAEVKQISESVKRLKKLKKLDLSYNVVAKASGNIAKALMRRDVTEILNVRSCGIGPEDMMKLTDVLAASKHLTELNISRNTCCKGDVDKRSTVAKSLVKCRALKTLIIGVMFGQNFEERQLQQLRERIPTVVCFK